MIEFIEESRIFKNIKDKKETYKCMFFCEMPGNFIMATLYKLKQYGVPHQWNA